MKTKSKKMNGSSMQDVLVLVRQDIVKYKAEIETLDQDICLLVDRQAALIEKVRKLKGYLKEGKKYIEKENKKLKKAK